MRYGVACLCGLAAVVSCGPQDPPAADPDASQEDVPAQPLSFDIGTLDRDAGAFAPLDAAQVVDIIIGFQGLVFVDIALRSPEALDGRFSADVDVLFADAPQFNYSFRNNYVFFERDPDGGSVSPSFRVPFGQDVALINGRLVTVDIDLTAVGWAGHRAADFGIEDLDGCIMTPTGEMECREEGSDP